MGCAGEISLATIQDGTSPRSHLFWLLLPVPLLFSHRELHLKKPSAEPGLPNSPTTKDSSVLPFQVESSNPLFGCSELDLQSLSMIPCSIGWTMPKRGRWEESPSQQASISCQHSSSNTGSRSGRTPLLTLFQR